MNTLNDPKKLLLPVAGSGLAGLSLRWGLYALAVDNRGLLARGHIFTGVLWVLTVLTGLLVLFSLRNCSSSPRYQEQFRPATLSFVGSLVAGLGLGLTVLLSPAPELSLLAPVWKLLGFASAVGLILAGFARRAGKTPGFLCYLIPCVFLLTHLVCHYQSWCADPQVQNYLFQLLGGVGLMLTFYYHAAYAVDSGNRRCHLAASLAGVCWGLMALVGTEYPLLYLSGVLFAATNLSNICPPAKREGQP